MRKLPFYAGTGVRIAVPTFGFGLIHRWGTRRARLDLDEVRRAHLRKLCSGDMEVLAPPPLARPAQARPAGRVVLTAKSDR